eukprot:scaffold11518_cov123-Amphora_coffeaeformis.AAC.2
MTVKKPNTTKEQRNAIIADLLDNSFVVQGERRLASGTVKAATMKFQISERTVSRIWKRAKENRESNGKYSASPMKAGRCGRKLEFSHPSDDQPSATWLKISTCQPQPYIV